MVWRLCILLFLFLMVANLLLAQPATIKGNVHDKETNQPLPFVSVYFENTSIGTTTNNAGEFILHSEGFPRILVVSHLGYSTFRKEVFASENIHIDLASAATALNEVTIYSKDTLRDMVKACFENIPNNYPYEPYQLDFFYRQSLSDTVQQFYLCEVSMQYQTSGYQHKSEYGRVWILRSKIDILNDSIDYTHHYGGPFIARFCDFVKRKASFIRGENDTEYFLKNKFNSEGHEIWVLEFRSKLKNQGSGLLYIDIIDKVFVRIEKLTGTTEGINSFVQIITTYKKINKKWFIESIRYKHRGRNKKSGKLEIATVDLVTTKLSDQFIPIPLDQQYHYGQPLTLSRPADGENFWKGKNIILPDSISNSHLGISYQYSGKSKYTANRNRNKIVGRFGSGFALQFLPYPNRSLTPSIQYFNTGGQALTILPGKRPDLIINLMADFSYQISGRVNIFFSAAENLNSNYLSQTADLGIRYSFLLNRKGRGILIKPGVSYCWNVIGQGYEPLPQGTNFLFNDHAYNQHNTRFFLGHKSGNVRAHLGMEQRVGGVWHIFLNTITQFPVVSQSERVILREGRGPLSKLHDAAVNSAGITITEPYSIKQSWFIVEVGFRYSLF